MVAARRRLYSRIGIALALAGTALSAPAFAQSDSEIRVKKLEAEVRALQRKVFPGSDGKYFEAEIARPAATTVAPPAVTTGPVNDLVGRIDAVEGALARITAQSEENANRMGKLEARLTALEGGNAAQAGGPAAATGPADIASAATLPARPASITGSLAANTAAMAGSSAAKPSAARIAAVAAIDRPVSGDQAEDDYLYGYRLWEAKFFPEAAQQLKATADKYPKGKRISYTRNLLGRAYLDDGKPGTAAQVFLQNYQADKTGDRAADSLLYLGVAMTRLKETKRACVALAEFAEMYPGEAAGRLANQYASAKSAVTCN
jgi:TolA-binding protein